MPVLIETLSVVIKRKAIKEKYPGGLSAFEVNAPFSGPVDFFCADDDLAKVGFMTPADVGWFCDRMAEYGIGSPEKPTDLVVVAACTEAPTRPCDWIEIIRYQLDEGVVLAARLKGSNDDTLVVPEGWAYETSATKNTRFTLNEDFAASLVYVGPAAGGLDAYREKATGELRYIGRPVDPYLMLAQHLRA